MKVNAAYNAWVQCNYMNPVLFLNDPFMKHSYNARWGYLDDETELDYIARTATTTTARC